MMELGTLSKNPAMIALDQKPSIDLAKIDESARDFEAMFVTEMMKPMFEGLDPDPMFGGGKSEEIFHGFMIEEYGKMMAQTGQIGIADIVKTQMIEMQEKASGQKLAQNMQGNMGTQSPALQAIVDELTGE